MVGNGKAVNLVLNPGDEMQHIAVAVQINFLIAVDQPPGTVAVILDQSGHRDFQVQAAQHVLRQGHLALAPIHQDQVREEGELALPNFQFGILHSLNFLQAALEAPNHDFTQGVVVIGSLNGFDLKAAVVGRLGLALLKHHHGADAVHTGDVGDVEGLNAVREFLEFQQSGQGFQGFLAQGGFLENLALERGQRDFGVAPHQLHQTLLVAPAGNFQPDLIALFQGQELLDQLRLLHFLGIDDPGDIGSLAVEGFQELAHQRLGGLIQGIGHNEVLPPLNLAVALEEDLNAGIGLVLEKRHIVLVRFLLGKVDFLLFLHLVNGQVLVAQPGGPLKVQRFRSCLHVALELLFHAGIAAVEQLHDFLDHGAVFRLGNIAGTGRLAQAHVVVEAGPGIGSPLQDGPAAGPDGINGLDGLQRLIHGVDVGEGAEVARSVLGRLARHEHPGEIFLQGDLDEGEALVVLQVDVVFGQMFLDQVLLENQRLNFRVGDDVFKFRHMGHHEAGFRIQPLGVSEVLANPVFQDLGLADIDNLAPGVFHNIDAGGVGQDFQLVFKIKHRRDSLRE
ncbi:hypothetical protein DSECCO2_228870 [anaerobic digester metagenome]